MAIGSPFYERSWSPAAGLREATAAEHAERESGDRAPTEEALDLGLARAAIQDGLLMVFGPDGDPVPPQVFAAAAAERPHAGVPLADGPQVPAERIAAVLDAQISGHAAVAPEGGEAWIRAMLGIGPRPEMVEDDELLAEEGTVEVVAFGRELMITSASGATFLLADAHSRTPVRLRLSGEGPVGIGDLVGQLLAGAARDDAHPNADEFAVPECKVWLEDDALRIELPEVGLVDLARADDEASAGPSVSLFMASGELATLDDLLGALSRPTARPLTTAHVDPPVRAMLRSVADAQRPHAVPLAIGLPDALAKEPNCVVVVVVRGLPEGASLSAGSGGGDGSWLLSPRDLPGLSITPPAHWASDISLEVATIAIVNPEGELTSAAETVFVPLQSAAAEPPPASMAEAMPSPIAESAAFAMVEAAPASPDEPGYAPIPLGLDPEHLSGGGPFDAVIVRDLPAGVALSAGTYDPAIAGWVLLPHQLNDLSVLLDGGAGEDFTLSLLAVSLRPGSSSRPRVLARVPVSFA